MLFDELAEVYILGEPFQAGLGFDDLPSRSATDLSGDLLLSVECSRGCMKVLAVLESFPTVDKVKANATDYRTLGVTHGS